MKEDPTFTRHIPCTMINMTLERENYINRVNLLIDRFGHLIKQHFLDRVKRSVGYGEEEEAFVGLIYQLNIESAIIDSDSLEIMAKLAPSARMASRHINAYNELSKRSIDRGNKT